jgi:hypothetical protein
MRMCRASRALVGPPPLVGVRDRAERHRHRAARRWRAHPRVNTCAGEGAGGGAGHHHPLHRPPWLGSSLDLTRLRVLERKGRGNVSEIVGREQQVAALCRVALPFAIAGQRRSRALHPPPPATRCERCGGAETNEARVSRELCIAVLSVRGVRPAVGSTSAVMDDSQRSGAWMG